MVMTAIKYHDIDMHSVCIYISLVYFIQVILSSYVYN